MSGSFLGLSIAVSGLFANQRALSVTSHNVANANTKGYSRQRMDMEAYRPDYLPGGMGALGTGTSAKPVKQIRDQFLDYKYRGESGKFAEWKSKYEVLQNVVNILNEPTDSGMGKLMNDFFSSLHEVKKNAESLSIRTLVRERALAFIKGIGNMSTAFKKLQSDLNFEFEVAVRDLNGYAKQISDLNKIIFEAETDGGTANDARDQRNLILDKLSKYAKISTFEDNQRRFHVTIGGHTLVSHYRADSLKITKRKTRNNPDDVDALVDVAWEDGSPFRPGNGKLNGLLKVRDNIEGKDKGIPYYVDRLNSFMDKLVSEMNRIHSGGYDLKGNTGINFFTTKGMTTKEYNTYLKTTGLNGGPAVDVTETIEASVGSDLTGAKKARAIAKSVGTYLKSNPQYKGKSIHYVEGRYLVVDQIKADHITLSKELEDVNHIAASKTQSGVPRNADNVLAMADVRHNVSLYDWGSPDDYVKSLISNLGVDGQAAKNLRDNQKLLVKNVETARESVKGVSLDEEMSNVIRYQHAYSANARMINTIDEMLDLIVNRLGLVGR